MQLPCLYCGVVLFISHSVSSWRTDFENILISKSVDDSINTETLQHDLNWDDAVDGSYDIDSARWDRARTWHRPPANTGLPIAHFRPVSPADGKADVSVPKNGATPKVSSSHKKDLNEEFPFYLTSDREADMPRFPSSTVNTVGIELEKTTVDDLKEVEITLGKDDGQIDLLKEDREQDDGSSTESSSAHSTEDINAPSKESGEEVVDIKDKPEKADAESSRPDVMQVTPVLAPFLPSTIGTTQKTPRIPLYFKLARYQAPVPSNLKAQSSLHLIEPKHDLTNQQEIEKVKRVNMGGGEISENRKENSVYLPIILACTGSAIFGCLLVAVLYRRYSYTRKMSRFSVTSDTPVYGITGPRSKSSSPDYEGDNLLGRSAEDYHYRSQRKQMNLTSSNSSGNGTTAHTDVHSDYDSEDEEDQGSDFGDYTVYECPGLAPAGEFEVINPMYSDRKDSRTSQSSVVINVSAD